MPVVSLEQFLSETLKIIADSKVPYC